jgi:4'-phosphopantetheinyl transferase
MCPLAADDGSTGHLVGDVRGGEVHVWDVALGAGAAGVGGLLSPSERERMQTFVSSADRRRYGQAHGATRLILGGYVDRPPAAIEFRADELGKPRLAGSELAYSLAHSGDRALVAVRWADPVGVDLEHVRPLPDADALLRTSFSRREREHITGGGGGARELLRLWTRKEALLKATGEGLRTPPREVDVLDDGPRAGWRLFDLDVEPGWVAAVAVRGSVRRVRLLSWQKKSRPVGDGPARASGEEVLL